MTVPTTMTVPTGMAPLDLFNIVHCPGDWAVSRHRRCWCARRSNSEGGDTSQSKHKFFHDHSHIGWLLGDGSAPPTNKRKMNGYDPPPFLPENIVAPTNEPARWERIIRCSRRAPTGHHGTMDTVIFATPWSALTYGLFLAGTLMSHSNFEVSNVKN